MQGSNRRRRRILLLVLGLPAAGLIFFLGALYYFIHFRFADSLTYAVQRASRGRYILQCGEARLFLSEGVIRVKGAWFHCRDTTKEAIWVDIRIPELYFSVGSWRKVVSQREFIVDSLAILRAAIGIHVLRVDVNGHRQAGTATDILTMLDSAMRQLRVRSFSLQDATFTYAARGGAESVFGSGEGVLLSIENFMPVADRRPHFFAANAVSVSLGRQHWVKPGGDLSLDLARLEFDNKQQRFEVDSLLLTGRANPARPKLELAADRIYFTSHDLIAIYRDGGLHLDSLVCINPVVVLPVGGKADAAGKKAGGRPFFNYIDARTVNVFNGRVKTRDANGQTDRASTRQVNLHIFGLRIHEDVASAVMADSIGVDLHQLEFLSRDGAHRLTIDRFGLSGNDAILQGVQLTPTHPEPGNTVVFTAPALVIRDISIADLMRNHLRAAGAQLFRPAILLTDRRQRNAKRGKMDLFYTTMHGLRELIDAPTLDIIDGSQHFILGGATPVEVIATGLQAHILLNKLFVSDNLIDIKQALPIWKVANFELISTPVRLSATGYELNGRMRSSVCREAHLSTANGWQLAATAIFWDALNWDLLQQAGAFHLDSVHIGGLIVEGRKREDSVRFVASEVQFRRLVADTGGLQWEDGRIAMHGLAVRRPALAIDAGECEWTSDSGMVARNINGMATLAGGVVDWTIPLATINGRIHSLRKRALPLLSVRIPQADVHYMSRRGNDTLSIDGKVRLTASPVRVYPDLAGAVEVGWNEVSGYRRSRNSVLSVSGLAGDFHSGQLALDSVKKNDWRWWLAGTTLTQGRWQYRTAKLMATVDNCDWEPVSRTLRLAGFAVSPILDRETSLKRAVWQSDFVTVRGRLLALAGIRVDGDRGYLRVEVPTLIVDGVQVEASRDKHILFHHGIEKAMPTKLLAGLGLPVRVDRVRVSGGRVTYNERPVNSSHWTSLTIDDINGELRDLKSRPDRGDTLRVLAEARLFNGCIRRFAYNESYGDSLSGFTAHCAFSAFDLTQLSSMLVPMASVSVVRGHVDTIWSSWRGNRNAAYGTMDLHYDRLRVSVLDKKDSSRRSFLPIVETWAANLVLPGRNKRESTIFFERDREKFVFNYWVKSQASGIISALLPSKGRSYEKRYTAVAEKDGLKP